MWTASSHAMCKVDAGGEAGVWAARAAGTGWPAGGDGGGRGRPGRLHVHRARIALSMSSYDMLYDHETYLVTTEMSCEHKTRFVIARHVLCSHFMWCYHKHIL